MEEPNARSFKTCRSPARLAESKSQTEVFLLWSDKGDLTPVSYSGNQVLGSGHYRTSCRVRLVRSPSRLDIIRMLPANVTTEMRMVDRIVLEFRVNRIVLEFGMVKVDRIVLEFRVDRIVGVQGGQDCVGVQGGQDCVGVRDGQGGQDCIGVQGGQDCVEVQGGQDCVGVRDGQGGQDCIGVQGKQDCWSSGWTGLLEFRVDRIVLECRVDRIVLEFRVDKIVEVQGGQDCVGVQSGQDCWSSGWT
ncbi:hypothetical protein PoB_004278400 [Plakobranchus ocellatus]|uniref:Uncharacterized protein n=1 Tax=Plakobranchus ocellatus TaxID=259542 RepID=A0AAV4B879_9GAST|nr:hypothetical protein PoB_004278400 [Plakobranchus ocellatus]